MGKNASHPRISVTVCIPFILTLEGPFQTSLKDHLYHSTVFSTVKVRVLMFTKQAMFVHKIYDFAGLTGRIQGIIPEW